VTYGSNLLRRLRHPESDTHRDGAWHGILRNTGWLLAGKIVGAVLSLIYLGLATRSLGPTAFGQFVVILGTGQAIATIVSFESWQLLIRYGMGFLRAGQSDALGRLVAFCTILDFAGAIIGAGLAVAGVALLGPWFGWSSGTQTQALIFCFVLLVSFRSAATGVLRLHDRFGAAALAETVTPVVRLIGALLVISTGASVTGLLIAWAVAELVTAIAPLGACIPRAATSARMVELARFGSRTQRVSRSLAICCHHQCGVNAGARRQAVRGIARRRLRQSCCSGWLQDRSSARPGSREYLRHALACDILRDHARARRSHSSRTCAAVPKRFAACADYRSYHDRNVAAARPPNARVIGRCALCPGLSVGADSGYGSSAGRGKC
jgi:hypothetical protein